MVAGVLGIGRVLARWPGLATALTLGGAAFLSIYGLRATWRALRPGALEAAAGATRSLAAVLAQAAAFTLLNPHVYLDTVLLVGAVGARQADAWRPWFMVGACAASLSWFAALGYGARWLAPWFARPAAWRWLDGLVGLTMFALAAALMQPWLAA
jgi:L-lysine exporter family protein LysE/ArgO